MMRRSTMIFRSGMRLRRSFPYRTCTLSFYSSCRDANSTFGKEEGTQSSSTSRSTQFGFEEVEELEKERKVREVFSNVATRYDMMNDAMSMGIHRCWKNHFVKRIQPISPAAKLVDVAGGTGDIAFRLSKRIGGRGSITVVDINEHMLEVGKQKSKQVAPSKGFNWVVADAESMPFADNEFDVYTIAFGIRNCTHVDQVLKEAHRILKPGGTFYCLEFSRVENPIMSKLYDLYSFQVIPVMGQVLAGDFRSYKYLVESIRVFPNQEHFKEMIEAAGFSTVTYENLTLGIAAIHKGRKSA